MLDVNMMERYWSETIPFRVVPVTTVEATSPLLRFVNGTIIEASSLSIPLAFMAAPKHMAQMIRYTVFIIPVMPLEVTSWFTSMSPVSRATVS